MSPEVSLVVPSRAGAERLPALMRCLAAQTHDDWEAVVVLDGDIDGSEAVLALWSERLPVRAIVFPENRGRPAALNAGFDAAVGRVLVRCDDDLTPGPDYVARHLATHADGPGGVIGMCENVYPVTTPYARVYGRPAYERLRAGAYAAPPEVRWRYWGGNVSVDRETWERVGPYDESYRRYGWEDVDWGYRLTRAGLPITVVPELETDHHVAATTTADRALRAYYSGSARHRFEAKHGADVLGRRRARDPWSRAVSGLARVMDERRVGALSRAVDRALPVLPAAVGGKLVALLVEAGARAGYRRSDAGIAL
jgi:glycosyltransferase involved in cell wall biosynthesis